MIWYASQPRRLDTCTRLGTIMEIREQAHSLPDRPRDSSDPDICWLADKASSAIANAVAPGINPRRNTPVFASSYTQTPSVNPRNPSSYSNNPAGPQNQSMLGGKCAVSAPIALLFELTSYTGSFPPMPNLFIPSVLTLFVGLLPLAFLMGFILRVATVAQEIATISPFIS